MIRPALLRDEDPAVRREGHRSGKRQLPAGRAEYYLVAKSWRQGLPRRSRRVGKKERKPDRGRPVRGEDSSHEHLGCSPLSRDAKLYGRAGSVTIQRRVETALRVSSTP